MNEPRVQPKGSTPDRAITTGGVRCRIVEFVATDTPAVFTAVLACGHGVRYDARPGAARKSKVCPKCTAARKTLVT